MIEGLGGAEYIDNSTYEECNGPRRNLYVIITQTPDINQQMQNEEQENNQTDGKLNFYIHRGINELPTPLSKVPKNITFSRKYFNEGHNRKSFAMTSA